MNKGLRKLSKYKVPAVLLALVLALSALWPELGAEALSSTGDYFLEMLSVVPPVFILMGLMDVWVPKETFMKFMGKGSGVKGALFSFLLGSFSSGPLYAAFPIATMFFKKGASLFNVFLFLGAWSTTKIPMALFEISQMGAKFAIARLGLNAVGVVCLALVMDRSASPGERAVLYQETAEDPGAEDGKG